MTHETISLWTLAPRPVVKRGLKLPILTRQELHMVGRYSPYLLMALEVNFGPES